MIVFKRTHSLPCFGLLKLFLGLLQAFLASESWAMEEAVVCVGKNLGEALGINVVCNLGQVTECLMVRRPFMFVFWGLLII